MSGTNFIGDQPSWLSPLAFSAFIIAAEHLREDTGEIGLTPGQLAERLDAEREDAAHAVNELVISRVVFRPTRDGRDVLLMNPHIAWRGSPEARQRAAEHVRPPASPEP